jgi:hypothetical protein
LSQARILSLTSWIERGNVSSNGLLKEGGIFDQILQHQSRAFSQFLVPLFVVVLLVLAAAAALLGMVPSVLCPLNANPE